MSYKVYEAIFSALALKHNYYTFNILGFSHRKGDDYYFTLSDLCIPSNCHNDGLFYLQEVTYVVQCKNKKPEGAMMEHNALLTTFHVNGNELEDIRDIASFFGVFAPILIHPVLHVYCGSIAKPAQNGIPDEMFKSNIIQNMVAASSGLNEGANW